MKKIVIVLILMMSLFTSVQVVEAAKWEYSDSVIYLADKTKADENAVESEIPEALTCNDANVIRAVKMFSFVINVIKIVIPVFLIIVAVKDITNAVMNQDDGEIKKLAGNFIKKFVIAVFIFFIPTIVNVILGYVKRYDDSKTKYTNCIDCLTDYSKCDEYINGDTTDKK